MKLKIKDAVRSLKKIFTKFFWFVIWLILLFIAAFLATNYLYPLRAEKIPLDLTNYSISIKPKEDQYGPKYFLSKIINTPLKLDWYKVNIRYPKRTATTQDDCLEYEEKHSTMNIALKDFDKERFLVGTLRKKHPDLEYQYSINEGEIEQFYYGGENISIKLFYLEGYSGGKYCFSEHTNQINREPTFPEISREPEIWSWVVKLIIIYILILGISSSAISLYEFSHKEK